MWFHHTVGREDVMQLAVRELPGYPVKVNITGIVLHSSFTIRSCRIRKEEEARRVVIVIGIARRNQTGRIDVTVELDDDTHCVYLGNDETPIWQRAHAF